MNAMLILTRRDVASLLTMDDALVAVEEGFRRLALGDVVMPQRLATPLAAHGGLHLAMPAFVGGGVGRPGTLAVKIVTVYGENGARFGLPTIQGVLLLHDARSGELLAMLDAEHLTAVRTGAASGVATKYLARPDAETALVFGTGALAPYQLAAVCAVRPIRRALVVSRTGEGDGAFCTRVQQELDLPVEPARHIRAAVEAADVICTATTSAEPLFDGAWLRPGTHVNGVGSYTRAMRELDTTAIRRSRVFVDHAQAAQAEAGDIVIPLAEGAIGPDHVAGELGQVVAGMIPGRTSPGEITVFKSVGLAMQDAVTAARVYAAAQARGMGRPIALD